MRPVGSTTVADKPRHEGIDERNARLESNYSYDRRDERSTMAFVSVYSGELTREFFEWREREYQLGRTTGEGIFDGLRRWEVGRFGARLDNGPHGVLLFAVRCNLAPEHGGRKLPLGYFDRKPLPPKALPSGEIDALAAKAARGTTMPRGMSRRQREERIQELDKQAAALRAEAKTEAARNQQPPLSDETAREA